MVGWTAWADSVFSSTNCQEHDRGRSELYLERWTGHGLQVTFLRRRKKRRKHSCIQHFQGPFLDGMYNSRARLASALITDGVYTIIHIMTNKASNPMLNAMNGQF